ncbi:hypothetical protein [Rhabdothermincola salaria]|uniref:hypothetical protein n=1 Tax=Rhabdothermincola salaria TaxID=2903142 RepID=UPI001E31F89E|nr:hypothetical protein [Rhabdothermincola salaria]MCD9623790.1 hypothetical protein [Rhabdothermincola salaria]
MAGLLAVLFVVVAACGPRVGEGEASEGAAGASVVRDAAERTSELATGRLRATVAVEAVGEGGGPTEVMVVDTAFDTGADRSSVTTTLDPSAMAAVIGEDLWGEATDGGELPGIDGFLDEPLTTVVDGDVVYNQVPAALLGRDGGGTVWVRVDGAFSDLFGAVGPGGGGAMVGVDQEVLEALEAVTEPVVDSGTEVVDGVETTRYEGDLDLREAAELVGEDVTGEDAAVHLDGLTSAYVVWIDADGLVRRAEVVLEGLDGASFATSPDAGAARELRLAVTMSFSDLGRPVAIEVPPADEVVTMADLFAGMAGEEGFAELGDVFGALHEADAEPAGS